MGKILQAPPTAPPYEHPADHLLDELMCLDVRLERAMRRINAAAAEDAAAGSYRGMYMSQEEAARLLDQENSEDMHEEEEQLLRQLEHYIAVRLASTDKRLPLPLPRLRQLYQLNDLELRLLVAAAAPHVDRKYQRLYGYVQDDMTCQYVTIDLLLRICCTHPLEKRQALARLRPASSFSRVFFQHVAAAGPAQSSSLLTRPIRLDDRIVHYMLGLDWKFEGPLAHTSLFRREKNLRLPPLSIQEDWQIRMRRLAEQVNTNRESVVWLLHGPSGSGKTFQARHFCASLGKALLEWDVTHAPADDAAFAEMVEMLLREARLADAIPAFDRIHTLLPTEDTSDHSRLNRLIERLEAWNGFVFLFGEEDCKLALPQHSRLAVYSVPLGTPSMDDRMKLWNKHASPALPLSSEDAGMLASKFRFTPGRIKAAADEARKQLEWQRLAGEDGKAVTSVSSIVHQSAYRLIDHRLQDKTRKIEPKFGWDDLILPKETMELLQQACSRLKHRHKVMHEWGFDRKLPYGRGISLLFTGPPGTGKTMSAAVMAKAMEAELYRVDLSRVVSKYIGETEKNLADIFDQARLSGAILFFDEADALFGKRSEVKDSHDKYANMETSYLLQKMEEYDGLTILATNFSQNLDEAFSRRIQFIVKFPFPDAEQREQLWRSAFPREAPLDDIDFEWLSHNVELSGGPIKNIVLTSAYLAAAEDVPVSMKHMMDGIFQEYKKSGKLLLKDRLGAYADYWKG